MLIRNAQIKDAAALLEIYRPYIDTNITFEIAVPSVEEFSARIAEITEKYEASVEGVGHPRPGSTG